MLASDNKFSIHKSKKAGFTIINKFFLLKKSKLAKKSPLGFTLIELLIVISIISVLSMVGMAVYSNIQSNTRLTATRTTINAIHKQIDQKRIMESKILGTAIGITGSGCTACGPCRNASNGFDRESVNSSGCIDRLYITYVTKLGMQGIPRDGWNDPIMIDENELEGCSCNGTPPPQCVSKDYIWSINTSASGTNMRIPFYSCQN